MNLTDYANIRKTIQNRMELRYVGPIYKALKNQISTFTTTVRSSGLAVARTRLHLNRIDPEMAATIKKIYVASGLFGAKAVRRIQKKGFGFNQKIIDDILAYFKIHLLEKAVLPISETTRQRIETVLRQGLEEGWSTDQILNAIESRDFSDMTRRRAQSIVRTETVRAVNYGGMAAAFDSPFEQTKQWIEVLDNRTRYTHRHASGVGHQVRDLLEPFSNGLMFPGDPDGPASETINCRCVLGFRLKRDKVGRAMVKPDLPGQNLLADVLSSTLTEAILSVQ